VITGAVLKLFPLPKTQTTCWLNVATPSIAVDLLNAAKKSFDAQLTAFELVSETALGLVLKNIPESTRPVAISPYYVLAEFSDVVAGTIENWLAEMLEAGLLDDAVLAQSETQARKLWALRENISEAQKIEGVSIKHDISVPVSSIPEFLTLANAALAKVFPGIRVVAFGHLGDGNLHYNLSKPDALENSAFIDSQPVANRLVHDLVHSLNGSISAEHGIGQLKREELLRYKSPVELAMMRSIKQALDPLGLMNPGKIL
jgi:FAD/FMN-containing dehydrogenase